LLLVLSVSVSVFVVFLFFFFLCVLFVSAVVPRKNGGKRGGFPGVWKCETSASQS